LKLSEISKILGISLKYLSSIMNRWKLGSMEVQENMEWMVGQEGKSKEWLEEQITGKEKKIDTQIKREMTLLASLKKDIAVLKEMLKELAPAAFMKLQRFFRHSGPVSSAEADVCLKFFKGMGLLVEKQVIEDRQFVIKLHGDLGSVSFNGKGQEKRVEEVNLGKRELLGEGDGV